MNRIYQKTIVDLCKIINPKVANLEFLVGKHFFFSHFFHYVSNLFIVFSGMTSRLAQFTSLLRSNFIQKQNGGRNL